MSEILEKLRPSGLSEEQSREYNRLVVLLDSLAKSYPISVSTEHLATKEELAKLEIIGQYNGSQR